MPSCVHNAHWQILIGQAAIKISTSPDADKWLPFLPFGRTSC